MTSVHHPGRAVLAAALALALGGCASFWDEVTSREFTVSGLWTTPDPLVTIKDSTDGARRAVALASLKEPARHGGSAQDQEAYLQILATAARTDREPLCRMGAIRALGTFRDARAARVLEEVYQQPKLPFTQEFNHQIRQQALESLEKVGDPESRHLLIRVARQPGPALDSSLTDRQQTQDEKVIALRALGRVKSQDSLETLVHVLKTEKDVAVRDQAHGSIVLVTGKRVPTDATYWQQQPDALALQPGPPEDPGIIQRVTGWIAK